MSYTKLFSEIVTSTIWSEDDKTRILWITMLATSDQHGEVMAKLAGLDKVLADVASHVAGFEPLANAMRVKPGLSDQAVSILRQMNAADASEIAEHERGEHAKENAEGERGPDREADDPGSEPDREEGECRCDRPDDCVKSVDGHP